MNSFLIRVTFAIFLITLITSTSHAQYQVQSPYLLQPELLIDFTEDCATFWEGVHDETHGGFYVEVGKSGNVMNTTKSIVSESRDAYGFTRAFMLTGNESYLTFARSALDFMYAHLWDEQYGGWYRRCSRAGASPFLGEKTAFDQHYALLGITAYFEATNSATDWQKLVNGYNFIDENLWDNRPSYQGYYDIVNRNGSNPYNKSFNATVDAITTHLYNLYLMTQEQKYFDRLLIMEKNIQDYLVNSMDNQQIGFAENYNSDWFINPAERRTIMGHVLKTGWCLGRIYRIQENQQTLSSAKKLVQDVIDNGYDHEYGGPYKDYDRQTGEMYMYGADDTAKAWWQMEQAMTSGFMLYEITGEDKYLKMADESLDFFMNYFVDPVYGEVYGDRNREGGRVSTGGGYWDENKGSEWKAAYHSIETAYYGYLYAKLLIKKEAATLYYKYDATSEDRSLNMNPLAVDFSKLKIDKVLLDGVAYKNFNADSRVLNIPSNTGGVFAVSYKMTLSPYAVEENNYLSSAKVYPNPFRDQVSIQFQLKTSAEVELLIYNQIGQVVEIQKKGQLNTGQHEITWANSSPPGLYQLVLKIDNQWFSFKALKN